MGLALFAVNGKARRNQINMLGRPGRIHCDQNKIYSAKAGEMSLGTYERENQQPRGQGLKAILQLDGTSRLTSEEGKNQIGLQGPLEKWTSRGYRTDPSKIGKKFTAGLNTFEGGKDRTNSQGVTSRQTDSRKGRYSKKAQETAQGLLEGEKKSCKGTGKTDFLSKGGFIKGSWGAETLRGCFFT